MFSGKFWRRAVERAFSFAAGSAVTVLGGDAANLLDVDFKNALGVVGGAVVLSLLRSVAASRVGDPESPSLVD